MGTHKAARERNAARIRSTGPHCTIAPRQGLACRGAPRRFSQALQLAPRVPSGPRRVVILHLTAAAAGAAVARAAFGRALTAVVVLGRPALIDTTPRFGMPVVVLRFLLRAGGYAPCAAAPAVRGASGRQALALGLRCLERVGRPENLRKPFAH